MRIAKSTQQLDTEKQYPFICLFLQLVFHKDTGSQSESYFKELEHLKWQTT